MPSSATVHDQLVRIIVQVVGCEPTEVVQSARLKEDLGVDSLSVIEVAEKLGETFGVYIPDEDVNTMRTVQDGINAVVRHDPSRKGPANLATGAEARSRSITTSATPVRSSHSLAPTEVTRRKGIAKRLAWAFAGVGLALGLVLGLGGTALIDASGMKNVAPPATATPTPTATKSPTPTPSPAPTATASAEFAPPSLSAAKTAISPGEKLRLTGAFPELGKGATIQVQVKDAGSGWDDFPVATRTRADGEFTTVIFTTRTGERQFRLLAKATNTATPAVTITIG